MLFVVGARENGTNGSNLKRYDPYLSIISLPSRAARSCWMMRDAGFFVARGDDAPYVLAEGRGRIFVEQNFHDVYKSDRVATFD